MTINIVFVIWNNINKLGWKTNWIEKLNLSIEKGKEYKTN